MKNLVVFALLLFGAFGCDPEAEPADCAELAEPVTAVDTPAEATP